MRGELPNGATNEVVIKVAGVVPFLVMKGMALWTRCDEKDSYDICYIVKNYPGGIDNLQREFEPFRKNKLVLEGLGKIRAKFDSVNGFGPTSYADFLLIDDEEDKQLKRRDAFMRITSFLDTLGIEPFEGS